MPIRKNPTGPDFARIFAALEAGLAISAEADAEAIHRDPVGWRGVPWLESGPYAGAGATRWADTLAWLELGEEPAVGEQLRPADPAAIAEELALADHLSVADLNRIRRAFALHNHPDLCAPAHRELATERMRIANMLIDVALQQIVRSDR